MTTTLKPIKGGTGAKLTRVPFEKHVTLAVAKTLRTGQILYHYRERGKDKKAIRCRVNGQLKLWKTRPNDYHLPVKHGLRDCFYIGNTSDCHYGGEDWLIEDPTEQPVEKTETEPKPA